MRRAISIVAVLSVAALALGCGDGLVTDARNVSQMRCADLTQLPDGGEPDAGVDECGGVTFGPVSDVTSFAVDAGR